jgi:hypothetical protein
VFHCHSLLIELPLVFICWDHSFAEPSKQASISCEKYLLCRHIYSPLLLSSLHDVCIDELHHNVHSPSPVVIISSCTFSCDTLARHIL